MAMPAQPTMFAATVLSPVHCQAQAQAAVNVINAAAAAQLPTNTNAASVSFLAKVSTGLKVVGSINIVFGVLICASDIISLAFRATPSFIFSGTWSGLAFGVINGALALKAATMKPHISKHWATVNLGFGITTFIIHLVPLGCTLASLIIYNSSAFFSDYTTSYTYISGHTYTYYYNNLGVIAKNILVSDAARLIMVVVLLVADICQLAAVSKTLEHYRRCPEMAVVVVTQGQPVRMQASAPVQMMYGAPAYMPASPYHAQVQPQVVYAVQQQMSQTSFPAPPYS